MSKSGGFTRRLFLGTPLGAPALAKQTKAVGGLVDYPRIKRDFDADGRSKTVVFLAHCILNQNARHYKCADFPAMMEPIVEFLRENKVGMIQMGCPELKVLGLGRDRDEPGVSTIREGLHLPGAKPLLASLIEDVIFQIKEYQFQGFRILGILGKNGSPSCGVERSPSGGKQVKLPGAFIQPLREALRAEKLDVPVRGVEDHHQEVIISWLKQRLRQS